MLVINSSLLLVSVGGLGLGGLGIVVVVGVFEGVNFGVRFFSFV